MARTYKRDSRGRFAGGGGNNTSTSGRTRTSPRTASRARPNAGQRQSTARRTTKRPNESTEQATKAAAARAKAQARAARKARNQNIKAGLSLAYLAGTYGVTKYAAYKSNKSMRDFLNSTLPIVGKKQRNGSIKITNFNKRGAGTRGIRSSKRRFRR